MSSAVKKNPHIMLIHGGGNAWWNYLRQARALSDRYHVILFRLWMDTGRNM